MARYWWGSKTGELGCNGCLQFCDFSGDARVASWLLGCWLLEFWWDELGGCAGLLLCSFHWCMHCKWRHYLYLYSHCLLYMSCSSPFPLHLIVLPLPQLILCPTNTSMCMNACVSWLTWWPSSDIVNPKLDDFVCCACNLALNSN